MTSHYFNMHIKFTKPITTFNNLDKFGWITIDRNINLLIFYTKQISIKKENGQGPI